MHSFRLCCSRRRASVWEGLYAPTRPPRSQSVGPALAAGPGPVPVAAVCDRRASVGGHRPPLQLAAFTLLELLVVLGLIGILSGIVLGAGRFASEKGKIARARAELAALAVALESYKLSMGDYPRTNLPDHLLQSLIGRRGPDFQSLNGPPLIEPARFATGGSLDPFLNDAAVLLDPWEHPYRYAFKSPTPWTNPTFVLWSAGPDGTDTATLLPGGYPDDTAPGNTDNVYANEP